MTWASSFIFKKYRPLRKLIILNNEWATDAVYLLLDHPLVKESWGKFSFQDFQKMLPEPIYKGKHFELLELMNQFKICYKIPDTKSYIVPQRLSASPPDYQLPKGQAQQLKYRYDFMPKGILNRFIVDMHHYIEDHQQQVWKSGVYLHKKNSTAEIIETFGKNEITIKVVGHERKSLWSEVMAQLDKINNSFHNLEYDKLIPCNCDRCRDHESPYFFKEARLRTFIENKRYKFPCEYPPFNEADIIDLMVDIPFTATDWELRSSGVKNWMWRKCGRWWPKEK